MKKRELLQVIEKYMDAIDAMYNHNAASRASVIQNFGLHHPLTREELKQLKRKAIKKKQTMKQTAANTYHHIPLNVSIALEPIDRHREKKREAFTATVLPCLSRRIGCVNGRPSKASFNSSKKNTAN